MALSVARLKHRSLANPSLFHLFSTSSSNDQNDPDNNDTPQSEFQRRSSVPPPTDPNDASSHSSREQPISFQELYKRNLIAKSENAAGGMESRPSKPSANLSFEAIREYLRQHRQENIERRGGDPISLDALKNRGSTVIGGTVGLPLTVIGKEMKEDNEEKGSEATRTEFVRMYKHDELGEKLRSPRPKDGVEEFSLHELSERVVKLRQIEKEEAASRVSDFSFKDLRDSVNKIKMTDDEKARKTSIELRQIEEEEAASRVSGVSFEDLRDSLNKIKMTDDVKARKTSTELRQIEEEEAASWVSGLSFKDLRDSLNKLKMTDDEKARKTSSP